MRRPPGCVDHESVNVLFVINDPPYGTERAYNGLRLANELAKREGNEVRVFLMADAVGCARRGQKTPNGYYNLERMLGAAVRHGAQVALCGTCMDARGMTEAELVDGACRSSLEGLADWTLWAERVIAF
ncbi:MAG TPA: DsrE family protein [Gaiellaceae bacterium]|nr:DsrE family protein [Gaiellaceae bacterium]